jgi:hypothetical protein
MESKEAGAAIAGASSTLPLPQQRSKSPSLESADFYSTITTRKTRSSNKKAPKGSAEALAKGWPRKWAEIGGKRPN